jgi:hypothetical protein
MSSTGRIPRTGRPSSTSLRPRTAFQDKAAITDRLRRALLAFQAAQALLLGAHRKARALASEESEQFWARFGGHIEAQQRAAAMEVVAAFKAFSAAGLVADTRDRHLVNQAERYVARGG